MKKPLDQLSPAYRRRIERAQAKGKTRQQSRGHREREHVERKERERENEGLTKAEQRIVFNWASKRLDQIKDHELEPHDIVQWAKDVGYDQFKQYRNTWDAARRKYRRDVKNGAYVSLGESHLTTLTVQAGAPDISWLYYH